MNKQYLSIFEKIDFNKIIDHPNILIAAAFWEDDRYLAAKLCYKYMRAIDDLIDCHKAVHGVVAETEKQHFINSVQNWIHTIEHPGDQVNHELIETIQKFRIPLWPLQIFARSMVYDIDHTGFASVDDFINYSQGASVAPASIFVHLNGITHKNGEYMEPCFDVKWAATPCALFSYFVHIIRDFQKDQLNHLNYFADDVMAKNGLTAIALSEIAHGAPLTAGFRNMMKTYYELAGIHKNETFKVIDQICPALEPRYRLSLHIIFSLYLMVYERINVEHGTFSAQELTPGPEEIKERVYRTIVDFRE